MIYTIGNEESYLKFFEECIATGEIPLKLVGGSVWQTREKAARHVVNGYTIFGVLADWHSNTEPDNRGDWRSLLVDAELVDLKENSEDKS